jgi:hypothetical protein
VIVSALKSYVGDEQKIWDIYLGKIEAAINTSVHVSTGFSLFFVKHGREMPLLGKELRILRNNNIDLETL